MTRGPARHKLDVWGTHLWVAATPKELAKVGKHGGPADFDYREVAGLTHSEAVGRAHHVVVYVDARAHETFGGLVNTCAHEASHVADAIFEHVEDDEPGAETRAYLVGWATAWLLAHSVTKFSGSIAQKKERP